MAKVNLWELITSVADKDLPNSDRCKEIKSIITRRFGTELSLEISEDGDWTIEVFNHEDRERNVMLTIRPTGFLTVTRNRRTDDLSERRSISF